MSPAFPHTSSHISPPYTISPRPTLHEGHSVREGYDSCRQRVHSRRGAMKTGAIDLVRRVKISNFVIQTESLNLAPPPQISGYTVPIFSSLNSLRAAGRYIGPTWRTHGKAKVTFSWWYNSKIVYCQQLIDYLAL